MSAPLRVGVLASGHGSNLQAILDRFHGERGGRRDGDGGAGAGGRTGPAVDVVAVGSDQPDARALDRARAAGVPTCAFPAVEFADRGARDGAMAAWLGDHGVELVVLAGYMQLVTPAFLAAFEGRVINIHPALLPAFPGIRAVEQALEYGVKVFGITVHFVDEGVDTGAIIAQRAAEIPHATVPDDVFEVLRPVEHELLCGAIEAIADGRVRRDPEHGRRVVVA